MSDDLLGLDAIQQALDTTGVYVAPSMAGDIDAAELQAIESAVADAPQPLYVVVYPLAYDDQFNGQPGDLLSRLHDASGDPGLYVATSPVIEPGEVRLDAREWTDTTFQGGVDPFVATTLAEDLHPDDLGAALVTLTEAVADGTAETQFAELPDPYGSSSETGSTGDDGSGATPYVVGGGLALALVLVVTLLRRRSATTVAGAGTAPSPSRRGFALPPSVVDRVRTAHDAELARRADGVVQQLGDDIDEATLSPSADAATWQSALDHYSEARALLGDGGVDAPRGTTRADVLDVVGAIVLAERGRATLEAALAGSTYRPERPCFLNPLHGRGTTEAEVDLNGSAARVPLCTDCRTALRRDRRPEILDVLRDGRPVHYFETDHEPWASTGYGALHTDLVERLQRLR